MARLCLQAHVGLRGLKDGVPHRPNAMIQSFSLGVQTPSNKPLAFRAGPVIRRA